MTSRYDQPDAGPMPSGHGRSQTMALTCRGCAWTVTARPLTAVSLATLHAHETGHDIAYRGVAQKFSQT